MQIENPCEVIEVTTSGTEFLVRINRCPHCEEIHEHKLPSEILLEVRNTINICCPKIKRLPRFTRFYFDLTPNIPKKAGEVISEEVKEKLKRELGEDQIDDKYLRWEEISKANIWILEEFNQFLDEIIKAYIQGYYYISITGACCLTERLLNRLIIKLKDHNKKSPLYKKIYDKEKQIQNWDTLKEVLEDWGILNEEQLSICKKLHRYRNDTVHYIPEYDFKSAAPTVIKLTTKLIDSIFSVFERKDIFNIFIIPGEIWVKECMIADPFVKEFILPCCSMAGAISQIEEDIYLENGAIVGDLTEEEFIKVRTDYGNDRAKFHNGKSPLLCRFDYDGSEKFIRLI